MNDFEAVIDLGSKNLKLGIFDLSLQNIYSSEQKIIDEDEEKSLNILIKDAEKYLSTHISNITVLYDTPKYYSLDISTKKVFDDVRSIKKVYRTLIEEAYFFVSQNNFKDQIIHTVVNNIVIDENKILKKIDEDLKIKSIILEIKFICLSKVLIDSISNKFRRNNLKVLNLYCSSYVKSFYYLKKFDKKDFIIFIDIGFERTSGLVFNNYGFDFYKSISFGGNTVTKDISKVLKLNLDFSEDLKVQFNKQENNIPFNKISDNYSSQYSEILENNISSDLLKKTIEARIDEIFELVIFQSDYFKYLNKSEKPKLVITGGGSRLLSNSYNLSIKNSISDLIIFNKNNSQVCEAGIYYQKSYESSLSRLKKKGKKYGFFERFFNLFSN